MNATILEYSGFLACYSELTSDREGGWEGGGHNQSASGNQKPFSL